MILITDYEGDIVAVNRTACQLIRRPKDAIIGLNIGFVTPELKQFLDENTNQFKAWRDASLEIEITDAYRHVTLQLNWAGAEELERNLNLLKRKYQIQ